MEVKIKPLSASLDNTNGLEPGVLYYYSHPSQFSISKSKFHILYEKIRKEYKKSRES